MLSKVVRNIVAGFLILASGPALAWPDQTVRMITPTGAGGGSDTVARIIAEQLSKRWQKPVIVDNRPGADGMIAVGELQQDRGGHSLLFTFTSAVTINPLLYEKLTYDPARDLTPISSIVDDFMVVVATPSLQANSLMELVTLAKERPRQLNYATVPGGAHLGFVAFQKDAGIELTFVPYRNPIASMGDLMEGRIEIAVMPISIVLGYAQAGKVKALAVASEKRAPAAPDIPTTAESGAPAFTTQGGLGLFGSRDMPVDLRRQISDDVREIVSLPEVQHRLKSLGYLPHTTTPKEFADTLAHQSAKYAAIAKANGVRPAP